MVERKIFEPINAVLQDPCCGRLDENEEDTIPTFRGIKIVFGGDYMQIHLGVSTGRWKDSDGKGNRH